MIIGICGYGYTGSGALLDLLLDYKDFAQSPYDVEFIFPYYPDGLESLAYNLYDRPSRFMGPDIAIYRFEKFMNQYSKSSESVKKATEGKLPEITKEFINEISDISWNGNWLFDFYQLQDNNWGWFYSRVRRFIQRWFEKHGIKVAITPKRKMRISDDEEKFYKASKEYVKRIIDLIIPESNSNRIILNQPFAANFPSKSFVFFDDPFAILVDRDPRDVYILSKKAVKSRSEWIPTDDVKTFIKYYKWMHKYFDIETKDKRVCLIHYEDIIFNTEQVITTLEAVIGAFGEKNGERHFKSEVSINNTQLFYKYPEYEDDISKIESELSEFLYDFTKKPRPSFETKAF